MLTQFLSNPIEIFYGFLMRYFRVNRMCLCAPRSLVEAVFEPNDKEPLPDPFTHVAFSSVLAAVLVQYTVLVIQTTHFQDIIYVVESISLTRLLVYTLAPTLCVYVLSALFAWLIPLGESWDLPRAFRFFCCAAGFQMFSAICWSLFVLLMVLWEWLVGIPYLTDYLYVALPLLCVAAGVRVIVPFVRDAGRQTFPERRLHAWLFGFTSAGLFFLAPFLSALLPFVAERQREALFERDDLAIIVADIRRVDQPAVPEDVVELAAVIRNVGRDWYYLRRQNASLRFVDHATQGTESDLPRFFDRDFDCFPVSTSDKDNPMIVVGPGKEEWAKIQFRAPLEELRRFLSERSSVDAVLSFHYMNAQNLESNHASVGKFPVRFHIDWLKPFTVGRDQ